MDGSESYPDYCREYGKTCGKAQAEANQALVEELETAFLPEGKKVEYLFAEADGVFIRGLKKKQSMEVHHAILYEGWETNGKRVSLRQPKVVMTTEPIQKFWDEVQATAASTYSLEKARIITNSVGDPGYTAERFQTAFSQSAFPVLNQAGCIPRCTGRCQDIRGRKERNKGAN